MREKYVRRSKHELRELVEAGEIVAAIEHEVQRHGITEFEIVKAGREVLSSDAGVDVYDTWGVSTRRFSEPPYTRPVFLAGAGRIKEMEQLSGKDAIRAEMRIGWGVAHEAGHVFRPKNPAKPDGRSVPWTADEIWDCREKNGMDNYGLDAVSQRESQANLYAMVKCNEDMGIGELKEHIAAMFWEAIAPDYGAIEQLQVNKRETAIREAAYGTVACLFSGMKPRVVDEIAGLAVGKYRAYATGKNI